MRGRHADRSARRTRPTRNGPDRRLIGAAAAAVLSLLLFTNGLGTWSFWQSEVTISGAKISSGFVSLTETPGASPEVQLLSQQLAGKRTYESSTNCAASPYVECRVVTSTLPDERLIPGDTLRIVRGITLDGQGTNLKGNLVFDATKQLNLEEPASEFAKKASVSLAVTGPNVSITDSGPTASIPVAAGMFGAYTVVVTITTPPTKTPSGRWNTELQGQMLKLGELTARFTQTP